MHGSIATSHWRELINMRYFRCGILVIIYLSGFLKALPPSGPFPTSSFLFIYFFSAKAAVIKTKSATTVFFSSSPFSPFFLLALSFSLFFFLRQCDFGAYRAQKTFFSTPFH